MMSVVQARRHAHRVHLELLLRVYLGLAEQLHQVLRPHFDPLGVAGRDLPGSLPGHRAQLPLEVTDTRFTSVARDDFLQGILRDFELSLYQPVLVQLARQQISPRDLQLLLRRVPDEFDRLHPVLQRPRDLMREVRRGDEHHLGQVERDTEVVIAEGTVLSRVEHLHEGRRRVSLERHTQLVHLVQQEYRVLASRPLQSLDDAARQRADVGAPVTPNVRLVARAAQRHSHVLPAHRVGD